MGFTLLTLVLGWWGIPWGPIYTIGSIYTNFNGGKDVVSEGEERVLVPSPRDVPTYDFKPEMSARGVSGEVVKAIESDRFDFILVNFANPDMVGHTGILPAAVKAIEAVDSALGAVVDAVRARHGAMLITADHGNCEQMRDLETGQPHTAHTTNPVPLVLVDDSRLSAKLSNGRLCDVAPTLLAMLGLAQPEAMTGRNLLGPAA